MLDKFYHSTIRKSIIAFGNMFNNITIDRKNSSGAVVQSLRIPLAYAPRQKFLARIAQQPVVEETSQQVILPRMSFEMTGIMYDPQRRISLVQQNRSLNTSTTSLNAQYAPTPYNMNLSLYIYSKNQDDALQIVEQILPYFNPDYNLSFKAIPSMGITHDLPILLENITYEDDYEGDLSTRRSIIWTLNFVMKLNFYGPINRQGIIRRVDVDTYSDAELSKRINQYDVTASPSTAVPGDTIDFVENFEDF
ncbi:MAG: tail sheath stabilizer and completion protein [Minisyncoccia bacterium]|jgi:hypothetical protein